MTVDERTDGNCNDWLWHSSFTYLRSYQLRQGWGYYFVRVYCFNLCSLNIVNASREGSGESQPSIRYINEQCIHNLYFTFLQIIPGFTSGARRGVVRSSGQNVDGGDFKKWFVRGRW